MFDTRAKNDSRTSVIVTLASLGRQTHICAKIIFIALISKITIFKRSMRNSPFRACFACAKYLFYTRCVQKSRMRRSIYFRACKTNKKASFTHSVKKKQSSIHVREKGDHYTGVFVALASLGRQTTPVWVFPTSHTCIENNYSARRRRKAATSFCAADEKVALSGRRAENFFLYSELLRQRIPPIIIVKKTSFLEFRKILAVVQACKMMATRGIISSHPLVVTV